MGGFRTGARHKGQPPAGDASPTCAPHLRAVPDAREADKLLHTGLPRQLAAPSQWLPGVTLPPHNAHWHRHGLQQLRAARWGGRGINAQAPAVRDGKGGRSHRAVSNTCRARSSRHHQAHAARSHCPPGPPSPSPPQKNLQLLLCQWPFAVGDGIQEHLRCARLQPGPEQALQQLVRDRFRVAVALLQRGAHALRSRARGSG